MPKELLAAGLDEMRRTIREKEPHAPLHALSTLVGAELTTDGPSSAAPKRPN